MLPLIFQKTGGVSPGYKAIYGSREGTEAGAAGGEDGFAFVCGRRMGSRCPVTAAIPRIKDGEFTLKGIADGPTLFRGTEIHPVKENSLGIIKIYPLPGSAAICCAEDMCRFPGIDHQGFPVAEGLNIPPVTAVAARYPHPLPVLAAIGAFTYHAASARYPYQFFRHHAHTANAFNRASGKFLNMILLGLILLSL